VAAGSTVLRLLMENAQEGWLAVFQGRGQGFTTSINKLAMELLAVFFTLQR